MSEAPFHELAQDLLVKQQVLTEQMLTLLKREYETLCTNFVEPLNVINLEKQPLIVELNTINQRWATLFTTVCNEMSSESIASYLQDYDQVNHTQLSGLWLTLQSLAKDCQKANTINGTIVTLRNKSAQQTMAILRGQVPSNVVYDPSGNNTPGYIGGNSLAKA